MPSADSPPSDTPQLYCIHFVEHVPVGHAGCGSSLIRTRGRATRIWNRQGSTGCGRRIGRRTRGPQPLLFPLSAGRFIHGL